jgi:hypothetical protein
MAGVGVNDQRASGEGRVKLLSPPAGNAWIVAMATGCPICGGAPATGVLCQACAGTIAPCEGLLPEHVSSTIATGKATAWLVDGFGAAHAVSSGVVVGRKAPATLLVLHASVSREHAELVLAEGAWRIRDLGSRNATLVDGQRVPGRAPLADGATLKVGQVGLRFIGRAIPMPTVTPGSMATQHAGGTQRYTVRGPAVELCLLGAADKGDATVGGAMLYRQVGASAWAELSLPPLEFQLLLALCNRAAAEGDSPARARGCVATRQLAKDLPFQSRYANEENVRQLVRRARATLAELGADEVIGAVPGRGYFLAWPIERG